MYDVHYSGFAAQRKKIERRTFNLEGYIKQYD